MLLPVVTSLSYLVVLATGVAANPISNREFLAPITLSITKNMSLAGQINFAQRDRARLTNLANAATGVHQFGASNSDRTPDVLLDDMGGTYVTEIGIGDPPTYCEPFHFLPHMVSYVSALDNLIVDTGSSNSWVGAFKPYRKTETSVKTGDSVVSIMSRDFLPSSK
jgi:cathepsin E